MTKKIENDDSGDFPGKRYAMSVRTTKIVRDRLAAAAKASGRSLAQELEYRLQRSVELDELAGSVGWHDTFWLMQIIAYVCDWMKRDTGRPWDHDETSRAVMVQLLHEVLKSLLIPPVPAPDSPEAGRVYGYVTMRDFVRVAADVVKDRSVRPKKKARGFPLRG